MHINLVNGSSTEGQAREEMLDFWEKSHFQLRISGRSYFV
jgi:hypothetical protein